MIAISQGMLATRCIEFDYAMPAVGRPAPLKVVRLTDIGRDRLG